MHIGEASPRERNAGFFALMEICRCACRNLRSPEFTATSFRAINSLDLIQPRLSAIVSRCSRLVPLYSKAFLSSSSLSLSLSLSDARIVRCRRDTIFRIRVKPRARKVERNKSRRLRLAVTLLESESRIQAPCLYESSRRAEDASRECELFIRDSRCRANRDGLGSPCMCCMFAFRNARHIDRCVGVFETASRCASLFLPWRDFFYQLFL